MLFSMIKREAIEVFDGLRKGHGKLKPSDDIKVLQTLLIGYVLPDGLGTPFSSALATLRSGFEEMDRWERRRSFGISSLEKA